MQGTHCKYIKNILDTILKIATMRQRTSKYGFFFTLKYEKKLPLGVKNGVSTQYLAVMDKALNQCRLSQQLSRVPSSANLTEDTNKH